VLIDPLVRIPHMPFVTHDNYAVLYEATSYLIGLGHKRIVHITIDYPLYCVPAIERRMGYEGAMYEAELNENCHIHRLGVSTKYLSSHEQLSEIWSSNPNGQAPDAALEASVCPATARSATVEGQVEHLLSEEFMTMMETVRPTACCCYDDSVAARVLSLCHEAHIRVPDELSVVGVNDTGMAAHLWPPLTTVHLALDEMGRIAVRTAQHLIEERQLTGGGILVPARLVPRASTKPLD
jgi:DNA-binding LacI/PurR family transcriptional regulator